MISIDSSFDNFKIFLRRKLRSSKSEKYLILFEFLSDFEDINFFIRNILKISNEESLEIISQSIPEKNPIIYKETRLKIL